MLTTCSEPGCVTLVMGGRCLEHERRPTRAFVRGRPYGGGQPGSAALSGYGVATLAATGAASALDVAGPVDLARGPSRSS
jgi:hypothetical protein